jgi:hypothetical protein
MQKTHNNLLYCYTCGYDVDHDGFACHIGIAGCHIPNVKRDKAHMCPGASMKAQHKMLPDGTGQGKGWLLAPSITKAQFTMNKQQEHHHNQQRPPTQWSGHQWQQQHNWRR